jgi:predicted lipoprotein with Yx(FWY)xxD motif
MYHMKELRRAVLAAATVLLLAIAVYAVRYAQAGKAGTAAVKVAAARVLVTPDGYTLYVFAADPPNKSTCYKTCAKFWPPVLVAKGTQPAAIAGVPGTFGVTVRTDGTQQLTYDHAPLYTFLLDKKPGDMKGQGLFAVGGYWWMVVAGGK